MTCYEFERIADYADGLSKPGETKAIKSHLSGGCPKCGAALEWYARVRSIAAGDDSVEPPAWVFNRALKGFTLQHQGTNLRERAGRLVASLAFDSLRHTALAGARSADAAARQLLYRAEPYSIDVTVGPDSHRNAGLIGQILREGEWKFESVAGLRLALMRDGLTVGEVSTNDAGEFAFETLDRGQYDLRIDTLEVTITIVGLPIV